MRRLTVPLRSIAPLSYWKLKVFECGFGGRLEKVQNFTALSGHSSLGPGTEPILRTLQVQTVNALRFGERSRASSLLLDVGNGNHPLTANDFVHILEYCARSPDPLFVLETWRIMGEKDVYVDNKSYLLILQALCKGGYLEEAFNLMNVLGESHDFYPVLSMYNDLLGGCARIQSVNHANKCLDLMERQMVGKNEITYAQLLKLAVLQQDFSAVHEIWKEYIKHYSPSIISLRKFVWAFTMLGNLEDAYTLLQYMVALALRGGFVISRTAEGKFFTSRLDIPIPLSYELVLKRSNKESEDYDYSGFVNFKTMETCVNDDQHGTDFCTEKKEVENAGLLKLQKHSGKSCMKVLRWSFNDLIHSCAKSLNYRLAEQLILQMQNLGLEPSRSTYDGFVRAVISERGYHGAIEVLKAMQQKNLKPYDSTLATIAISCSKGLELDLAESLLVQISKSLYVHPYNAFLEACDTMLKALGGEGMVKELIQYLHVVENQFSRGYFCLGTPAYNTVLHSLVEAKESHMAIEIFKSMMSYGFLPDAATYNIMIDCCSVIRCFKSACALVSMMVRNGFYPQTITYATLIKILLGNGDLDGALYLLDQGSLEGIQSDVLLFNTILQGACEKGRIDVIENIVRRMHQEKVQPDATTCYYVFFAYVDHDYISTAVEALQVLCMWMLSEEDSMLEEQRRELEENFILAEDLEAESRIVELFKDSKENLAAALLNLRWCATLGFPISWLPDQSPWMRRISSDSGPREGIA
ncbi:pentatricopeptide repeat-containing protein At1g76280 isoform X6 [Diospyros lotus]|uniref:pentatricopeptide repeat-containing protein At1g76280 isoform X6 n=1 Tax=Diospyros lotus TaxID=55363 RepID=UPI002251CC96|nr:pentatricopeptide repeat-containing protein At1g76280 isoform X6 [Diospyros lotus]